MQQQYEVHPAAECCRLMDDEELAALAADIAENGQRDPAVLGRINGHVALWLIDGRNRVKACENANVEPIFETREFKDDADIIAFVRSRTERRDLTKGQKAMAMALLYPEPEKGGRGKKAANPKETLGFSTMRLSQARTVLAFNRDLALAVRDGSKTLDAAYADVQMVTGKTSNEATRLRKLRDTRPDLAERVIREELTIDEATALDKRQAEEERQRRWAATKNLVEGVQMLDRDVETVSDLLRQFDPAIAEQMGEAITPERLFRVASFVEELGRVMEYEGARERAFERAVGTAREAAL